MVTGAVSTFSDIPIMWNEERVLENIYENRRVTVDSMVEKLNVIVRSAYS